jgi:hypothetical protein
MFSRDTKYHRAIPHTIQQAFGPYHRFDTERKKFSAKLGAALAVIVIGVWYGWMVFQGIH